MARNNSLEEMYANDGRRLKILMSYFVEQWWNGNIKTTRKNGLKQILIYKIVTKRNRRITTAKTTRKRQNNGNKEKNRQDNEIR